VWKSRDDVSTQNGYAAPARYRQATSIVATPTRKGRAVGLDEGQIAERDTVGDPERESERQDTARYVIETSRDERRSCIR